MGAPTNDRDRLRIQHLEKQVQRLELRTDPRRLGTAQTPRFSRLAITVPEVLPPLTEGGDPVLLYPLPPADVFPIQFIDVLDNDSEETDIDFDKSSRADEDDNPMTVAMHVRGEYVARGTVVEVLNQRPINGTKTAETGLVDDAIEWWITGVHDAVAVKNTTGDEIPAHAVMVPGDIPAGDDFTPVTKPDSTEHSLYLVNSRYPIPAGGLGIAYHWTGRAGTVLKYGSETAAVGETWGPEAGSWELKPDGTGFVITRVLPEETLVTAIQNHAGGGTGERDYGRVKVQNVEAIALSKGNTVRLGNAVINPSTDWNTFADVPFFEARAASIVSSSDTAYRDTYDRMHQDIRRFAVLTGDIASGDVGYAVVSGVVAAYVYINNKQHTRVRIRGYDNTYQLETSEEGEGVILWMPPDVTTGSFKMCYVNLPGAGIVANAYLQGQWMWQLSPGYITTANDETCPIDLDISGYSGSGGTFTISATNGAWGSHLTEAFNFEPNLDLDGVAISGSDILAFRAKKSGTYLVSLRVEANEPVLTGTLNSDGTTPLDLLSLDARYKLYIVRRRTGQFVKRETVKGWQPLRQTVQWIKTTAGVFSSSGNNTIGGGSDTQARKYDNYTCLLSFKQGDLFSFALEAFFDDVVFASTTDNSSQQTPGRVGPSWQFYGQFSFVLVNASDSPETTDVGWGSWSVTTDWETSSNYREVSIGSGDGKDAYVLDVPTLQMYLLAWQCTAKKSGESAIVIPFNRFNSFSEKTAEKVHDLASDTLKWMLTNTAPVATNTVKSNITEISAGSGYSAGGSAAAQVTSSQSDGKYKLVLSDTTFTASGGSIGPFRYAVLYNDTATNDELIGWMDYGSSITVADGGTFRLNLADSVSGGAVTMG